jgi:hypothetical protein
MNTNDTLRRPIVRHLLEFEFDEFLIARIRKREKPIGAKVGLLPSFMKFNGQIDGEHAPRHKSKTNKSDVNTLSSAARQYSPSDSRQRKWRLIENNLRRCERRIGTDIVDFIVLIEFDEQRPFVLCVIVVARHEPMRIADDETFANDLLPFVFDFDAACFVFVAIMIPKEIVKNSIGVQMTRRRT